MTNKEKIITIVTVVISIIPLLYAIISYKNAPDVVPIHYNINGIADNFASKSSMFIIPVISIGSSVMMLLLKNNGSREIWFKLMFISTLCVSVLSIFILHTQINAYSELPLSFSNIVIVFVGIIFISIGYYMPKSKPNRVFGIRTRATLKDENNWNKTHKLGGTLYFLSGIIIVLSALFIKDDEILPNIVLFLIISSSFIPIVYSYIYSKKQK